MADRRASDGYDENGMIAGIAFVLLLIFSILAIVAVFMGYWI